MMLQSNIFSIEPSMNITAQSNTQKSLFSAAFVHITIATNEREGANGDAVVALISARL